jgi:hypothetical protein
MLKELVNSFPISQFHKIVLKVLKNISLQIIIKIILQNNNILNYYLIYLYTH